MAEFVEAVKDIGKRMKSVLSRLITPSGKCTFCQTVTYPDEMFCSQNCCLRYWTRYSKGHQVCRYPGCGKPCFVDANRTKVLDFCGRSHASQYKEFIKQRPSFLGSRPCGYPYCTKPCYVDRNNGVEYAFCGRMHATEYEQLQNDGPVHSSTHQGAVFTSKINNNACAGLLMNGPIYFYNSNDRYYQFTNFYERPIEIDNKTWNTSEHYFQAQKFIGTPFLEIISKMQRPREAFDFSRNPSVFKWVRSDWDSVKLQVMYKALLAKFIQHEDLKFLLLQTENRELIEHTFNDNYWGDGGDGSGQNELGKLLMRVRKVLRTSSIASDGDDAEDGGGQDAMESSSGNGCIKIGQPSDKHDDSGSSYMDYDSIHVSDESEDDDLLCYPFDELTDSSDQCETARKNATSDTLVDLSIPSSVGCVKDPVATGQKPGISTCTCHTGESSAELMQCTDGEQQECSSSST